MTGGPTLRITVPIVMSSYELLVAGIALLFAVGAGIVVHELLHAVVLKAAGVSVEIDWFHGRSGQLGAGLFGTLASVRIRTIPDDLPAWQLRIASLAPLSLATPLVAVAAGLISDPFAGSDVVLQAAVVGWLACALPSPADFSLFWYAESAIAEADST